MPLGACPLNSRLLHTQDRIRLWSGLLIASALMAAIAANRTSYPLNFLRNLRSPMSWLPECLG